MEKMKMDTLFKGFIHVVEIVVSLNTKNQYATIAARKNALITKLTRPPRRKRRKKMIFEIKVSQIKYPEYPCFSFYTIESWAEHDARKKAKERFQDDTGFNPEDTQTRILNKDQFGRFYER